MLLIISLRFLSQVGLGQASRQLGFFRDESLEINCALTWELAVGCVDLFTEFVDLQSYFLLFLASRHGLRLYGRQLRNVDSDPPDVGVGSKVGEVLGGGGNEVWVLDHVEWSGQGGKWCVLVCLNWGGLRRDMRGLRSL